MWLHGVAVFTAAQAIAAVGKMGAHGRACRFRIAVENGVVNTLVLTVDAVQVIEPAFGGLLSGVDAGSRNDHGAEVSH